ncbi:uncharacterized protein VTP21DRAFT_7798 [Calcarisporiella thermophila]|uniref:uncharacterized protein n=1 Tax=Calcarisporiella thermophila TaxID=911321 RepID=UPI0037440B24
MAFAVSWQITLVLLTVVPFLAFAGYSITRIIISKTKEAQDAYSGAGAVMEQALSGIRTVAAFSLQSRFVKDYERKIDIAFKAGVKKAIGSGISMGFLSCIQTITYCLGLWYGGHLISEHIISSEAVLQAFFAVTIGATSIGQIPPNFKALIEAQVAAYRIFSTIDRVPDIDHSPTSISSGKTLSSCSGNIILRNINFNYPSRKNTPVLHGINLEIPSGKIIALVGASGSGKSTILQLVQRFYDPTQGEVLLDGVALKEINVKWLRSQVGVVGQEPILFNDSIINNIVLGALHRNPTNEEIIEVCKKANCHDFISKLPKGYNTIVGERGSQLSGGQKQRIAIARALIRNPSILLLDEATSALDTHSENIVQEALKNACQGRSTIIVAHRLSTIKNAHIIVVMENGKIIEQGTYENLLSQQGAFYRYAIKQQLFKREDNEQRYLSDLERENVKKEPSSNSKDIISLKKFSQTQHISVNSSEKMEESRSAIEECLEVSEESKPVLRIIKMMRHEWGLMCISFIGSAMAGLVVPSYSFLFSKLLDAFSKPADQVEDASRIWALLFLALGAITFIGHSLRDEMAFFDRPEYSTATLTARLANEATQLHELPEALFTYVGQTVATIAMGLAIAFANGWKLTLILLAIAPLIILAGAIEMKAFEGFSGKTRKGYEKSGQIAGEAIKEIRTIASLGAENFFENKYTEANKVPHRDSLKKAYFASIGYGISQGFMFLVFAFGFYVGIQFVKTGEMSISQLLTTMFSVVYTAVGLGYISNSLPKAAKARQAAIGIFELMDKCTIIDPDADGNIKGQTHGDAELRDVTFAYPTRQDVPVFDGISLSISRNQKVALVGPSGCGKSTIIALLMRWYDALLGEVMIEGVNTRKWQLKEMRRRIALVSQEPVLFDMTIRENILYGREESEATQEQIEQAAKNANIHDFISTLPNGYHTRVGDKGSHLSGGQKQRIAIARALIRDPEILLLDEATSALDTESERLVQTAIDNAAVCRTTIVIAHKLASVQDSDVIFVIKEGRIVEQGNHRGLIALGGHYSELVKQQNIVASSGLD